MDQRTRDDEDKHDNSETTSSLTRPARFDLVATDSLSISCRPPSRPTVALSPPLLLPSPSSMSMDSYGSSSVSASSADDTPRLFINWEVVQGLLQANTDGAIIQHTLLLKLDGSLLTSSHETAETKAAVAAAAATTAASASSSLSLSSPPAPVLPKIVGALVANIWKGCESNGFQCLQAQALSVMVVECAEGLVAVSRLGRFLLAIYAHKSVERGTLRQKMNELLTQMQPLHRVYSN